MILENHLKISRSEIRCKNDTSREANRFFKENNYLRLKGILAPEVISASQASLAATTFKPNNWQVGSDESAYDGVHHLMNFLLKNGKLFEELERLTGRRVVDFFGRTFRLNPGNKGYSWHTDNSHGRVLGMTICLNETPFEGGSFLMRNRRTNSEPVKISTTQFGDALLFGIGDDWEHMVLPMEGENPKITFIGWFCSEKVKEPILAADYSV